MTAPPVTLICHPDTPAGAVESITVHTSVRNGVLALTYVLVGDLSQIRIPPASPPTRADGLWHQTCFEAFIARPDQPAYHEFNFAPSGAWAAYAFSRYREAGPRVEIAAPEIGVQLRADAIKLTASVRIGAIVALPARLALSAVVEDVHGRRSYWALRHPPGKPDFHHLDAFALTLET